MSYYKKNKEVLLEKACDKYHNKGGKERAKRYYQENKEEIKKKERLIVFDSIQVNKKEFYESKKKQ